MFGRGVALWARQRSLYVYHRHMGGPDADALEWRAITSSRFTPRLHMGVTEVSQASEADVVVLTGLLTEANMNSVLGELARVPSPAVLITAGDAATNGGKWAAHDMPRLAPHILSYYADVQISVPGDPPTPQALIAALVAAAEILSRPARDVPRWREGEET